jgi:TrpR-related protein YerC/YecD
MGKIKAHEIGLKEKYKITGDLFEIILNLKLRKEVVDFFVGLITPSELLMLARRIQIARKLLEEKSYFEIKKELKVGNETIFRTDKWLNSRGEEYRAWIKNCIEKVDSQKKNKGGNKKSYDSWSLLNKYPEYQLWKELLGR